MEGLTNPPMVWYYLQPSGDGRRVVNLAPYKKFLIAGIGLAVLVAKQAFGIDVGAWFGAAPVIGEDGTLNPTGIDTIVDAVIGILTAVGVYQAKNAPLPK